MKEKNMEDRIDKIEDKNENKYISVCSPTDGSLDSSLSDYEEGNAPSENKLPNEVIYSDSPNGTKCESNGDVSLSLPREALGNGASVSKAVFARMPLIKLWFVLILTFGFAVVLLVASHVTHSLTLRVEAYHALYNVVALCGCLFTMKLCERSASLKNTFGWARVELLSCLCSLLFIASLCFSVTLESVQTAAHAGHQDAMHYPQPVIALGGLGLCLNAIVFCLIGGYTHHQGCFLERRSSGVWVQSSVTDDAVQAGKRTLLSHHLKSLEGSPLNKSYEGLRGVLRDITGLVMVMLCAAVVNWDTGETLALYIDPAFAVLSASILLFLSFPYGKECCQILLQTIPGNIDVQQFSATLLQEFPEVINVHHLHIWSLTPGKVIATAHVVYSNPKVFHNSIDALEKFFFEKEITKVTLQPEFVHYSSLPSVLGSSECLIQCSNKHCLHKQCCTDRLKEGIDVEKGISDRRTSTVCTLELVRNPDSRELSVCGDHHGTAAFRTSSIDIPMFRQEVYSLRKSKSKEDLMHNKEKIKLSRSYSFHLLPTEKSRHNQDLSGNKLSK